MMVVSSIKDLIIPSICSWGSNSTVLSRKPIFLKSVIPITLQASSSSRSRILGNDSRVANGDYLNSAICLGVKHAYVTGMPLDITC